MDSASRHLNGSSPSSRKREDKRHMPDALMRMVAENVITNDVVVTAKNLTNLARASKDTKRMLDDGDIGNYRERIKVLGSAAKRLFDHAIPEAGPKPLFVLRPIDPSRVTRLGRASTQTAVDKRIEAIAPIIKFQSTANQDRLINAIFELDDRQQGQLLGCLGRYINDFHEETRGQLLQHSVELFMLDEGAQGEIGKSGAGEALVHANAHLSADQKTYIFDQISHNPTLARLYARATRDARDLGAEGSSRSSQHGDLPPHSDNAVHSVLWEVESMVHTGSTHLDQFKTNAIAIRNAFDHVTRSYDERRRGRTDSNLSR